MFKSCITTLIISVFLFNSCTKSQEKTVVTVRLSEADIVYAMSNSSTDSVFLTAFRASKKSYDPSREYFIEILAENLLKLDSNVQLASYFATFEFKDRISFNSPNVKVIDVIKEAIKSAQQNALQILKARIETAYSETFFISKLMDNTMVEIVKSAIKNTWAISVNKKVNKESLKLLLQRRADLGFWETYRLPDIFEYLRDVNNMLALSFSEAKPEFRSYIGNRFDSIDKDNPMFSILRISTGGDGSLAEESKVGFCAISDTAIINKYMAISRVKSQLPRDLKLLWDIKPVENNKFLGLYAIKASARDGKPYLDGSFIEEARGENTAYGPVVSIKMNAEGTRIWSRLTRDNVHRQLAMVINNKVFSCPFVNSQIDGGRSEITGSFTEAEVKDLAGILDAGVMPPFGIKVLDVR